MPTSPDRVLASEELAADRKLFAVALSENARGRFFKISEQVGSRRNILMLPLKSAREFLEALARLAEYEKTLPGKAAPSTGADGAEMPTV